MLDEKGIAARVIDCYSIKPIDADTLLTAAADTDLLVTAEDHYIEGGLGSAVAEVLAEAGSRHTAAPTSGQPRPRIRTGRDAHERAWPRC